MKTIRIQIPDSKLKFFVELLQQLGLKPQVEENTISSDQLTTDIQRGLYEVRDIENGKLPKKTLKNLLDEL